MLSNKQAPAGSFSRWVIHIVIGYYCSFTVDVGAEQAMQNLWTDDEAHLWGGSDLELRVYTSRLLGRNSDLVLHGGGNTSVKSTQTNIFGEEEAILYVKGSGWDLETIEAAGFSPARLNILQRLGGLESMTDTQMTRELKASMTDPGAPAPSVEAILHALVPTKYVDHTHTDAVVAISNTPNGEALLRDIYGDDVLLLPYVMPGFILAKQVYEATKDIDWGSIKGIFLMHHGLITFSDSARESYDNMIELVTRAEDYLDSAGANTRLLMGDYAATASDYLQLAAARQQVSQLFGHPLLAHWKLDAPSIGYSCLEDVAHVATRGPVTPDHSLHTKRIAAIFTDNPAAGITQFERDYEKYFERHTNGALTPLDSAPRYAIWEKKGAVVFGPNPKRTAIISDILDHTFKAVQWGEALGGWQALDEKDIFDLEYWELEQAKLKRAAARNDLDGKVVVVSGAASGIGKATAEAFVALGAAVAAFDINTAVVELFTGDCSIGICCDVTSESSMQAAVQRTVQHFGGIDVLVCNAGAFPPSTPLAQLDDAALQHCMVLNCTAHVSLLRLCTPFLKLGFDPAVVLMASKNVPAPGPGAGAYSAAKAALTQFGRVAALELGASGIRVNMLHPNAVFDTGVWTEEVLQQRAQHYGLSVAQYKASNVLRTEVTSVDVAAAVVALAGCTFSRTTGAQVPVDGGNERVI